MKLMHLSDLHLGIKVYEYDLYEDQKYILNQIFAEALAREVDGIMISGDIYDRPVPPAESISLFDHFLTRFSNAHIPVYIISGNHDSQERLSFGAQLMKESGIYFCGIFDGHIPRIDLADSFGAFHIYLMPFLKPTYVRQTILDEDVKIDSYQAAVDYVLKKTEVREKERNVLLAHQFVTGAQKSESEEVIVGGVDNIDADSFNRFDYVALGHIHTPQKIGQTETVRYCGTPLKYSFSESKKEKSIPIITFGEKGNVSIELLALKPLRDLREIRGSYAEITARKNYINTNLDDYLHVTLTDEQDVPDAMNRLKSIYPNIMKLDYDNLRTKSGLQIENSAASVKKSPMELFSDFYKMQNGDNLSDEAETYLQKQIDEVWEEE